MSTERAVCIVVDATRKLINLSLSIYMYIATGRYGILQKCLGGGCVFSRVYREAEDTLWGQNLANQPI